MCCPMLPQPSAIVRSCTDKEFYSLVLVSLEHLSLKYNLCVEISQSLSPFSYFPHLIVWSMSLRHVPKVAIIFFLSSTVLWSVNF